MSVHKIRLNRIGQLSVYLFLSRYRRLIAFCALFALIPVGGIAAAAAPVDGNAPETPRPERLPDSCLPDFSRTLEKPAGKHGFLTRGDDGHFYWSDGTRARFWGINVSSTRLDIPPDQIEQVVETFARAGLNLVRLEAIDNRNCLLGKVDARDSRHLDKHYLDRLDHWIDALRRHGIYYYVDLLDFRTFKAGDGVLNADKLDRGARPYALYDRYLIELQKEYATQLLKHKNPYSGLKMVDDPALALVEMCNEHGFFLYPEKLETLVEPYRTDLRLRWNQWLRDHYGVRDKLASAWGMIGTFPALRPNEDPMQQSVDLPDLTRLASPAVNDQTEADVRRAVPRLRDGVQFLSELQHAYFGEMRDYLHELGLQIPITAVVSNDVIPDVASVAQECDFTAENWYGEGLGDDARTPGVRYFGNRNPLRDDSSGGFAPYTAALRWNNKPVVIREWDTTWPNRNRASSVPEALAYASLQDYDAILLFGYQTNRAPNGAESDALNDFAVQSDPTVWGLYALAGRAFLSGAIAPARHTLTLVYPQDRLYSWPSTIGDLNRAAWSVRISNLSAGAAHDPGSLLPTRTDSDLHALRAEFERLTRRGAPIQSSSVATGRWASDTGEISRFTKEGRLEVVAPTLRMVAGELAPNRTYALGNLRFNTPTRIGALFVFALDGLPLERSKHVIAKMVSRADNTGQQVEPAPAGFVQGWVLKAPGTGPVLTFGRPAGQPTRVWFVTPARDKKHPASERTLVKMNMVDGSWELEVKDGHATLACDTAGITGIAMGQSFTTTGGIYDGNRASASGSGSTPSTQRPALLP